MLRSWLLGPSALSATCWRCAPPRACCGAPSWLIKPPGPAFPGTGGRAGARAENVAFGCGTESCAIGMWEGSAGHRANMLLSDVKSYGLASAAGGGTRYWCLILGR